MALMLGEPRAADLRDTLARSQNTHISAANYVELYAVLHRRNRPELGRMVDRLLAAFEIEVAAFDAEQARVAAQAYRDYGRGSGHPARLNLGDCYSYALAHTADASLLFVGEDFVHTDIAPALR